MKDLRNLKDFDDTRRHGTRSAYHDVVRLIVWCLMSGVWCFGCEIKGQRTRTLKMLMKKHRSSSTGSWLRF